VNAQREKTLLELKQESRKGQADFAVLGDGSTIVKYLPRKEDWASSWRSDQVKSKPGREREPSLHRGGNTKTWSVPETGSYECWGRIQASSWCHGMCPAITASAWRKGQISIKYRLAPGREEEQTRRGTACLQIPRCSTRVEARGIDLQAKIARKTQWGWKFERKSANDNGPRRMTTVAKRRYYRNGTEAGAPRESRET